MVEMTRAKYFVALCVLALGCLLATQAKAAKGQLSEQERYVVQQVAAGELADLGDFDEAGRTLSASFLEDLLTGVYKVHRKGIWIAGVIITERLDLQSAHVQCPVSLQNCQFKETFFCRNAVFEKYFDISLSKFGQEVDFQGIRVKDVLSCTNATFRGPVNFNLAKLSGQFNARGAQFIDKATFNAMKVKEEASFEDATFKKGVDFVGVVIGGFFIAEGAQFQSDSEEVKFTNLKVSRDAFFHEAEFHGPVDFRFADINGQFNAKQARFLGQCSDSDGLKVGQDKYRVNFDDLKVGQSAVFDDCSFEGSVNFRGANIGGQFSAKRLNCKNSAYFDAMKVWHHAYIDEAIFNGPADFRSVSVMGQFNAEGAHFLCKEKPVIFQGMQVGREAFFHNVTFLGDVDFKNAKIEVLRFQNFELHGKAILMMDGLTYTSLFVDKPDNFQGLLGLVERSAFKPQNYLELEEYCKRIGHSEWADKVYIAMKERELEQIDWTSGWGWLIWIKNNVFVRIGWGWLAGYGRYPFRTFGLGFVMIIIGTIFMFDPKYLKIDFIRNWNLNYKLRIWHIFKKDNYYKYLKIKTLGKLYVLRFIISFDQFIPAIDLGMAKNWQPPELSFGAWFYVYFQKISGWILVPIGLAAIYSQFK